MSRKRQKRNNTEEIMDALVEDYFRYEELAQMEAEAIRHNIIGSVTEVLEYRELDEVPRELISNVEIGGKENPSPDQTDNQEVVQRFRIYSDAETDAFLKENKKKNPDQKTKSDMKIVTDFFRSVGEFRDPAKIPLN
jgi:serine/threonine protein kinase HipA of HipAB toxin-antitoxin module